MSTPQRQVLPTGSFAPVSHRLLQRKCACHGECEDCRDKQLFRKPRQNYGSSYATRTVNRDVAHSAGHPLDGATRAYMEPSFGHDFSRVRVHTDTKAAESARAVNARAFTVGQCIYFDSGEYRPDTLSGKRLLAHELAHTIQQRSADTGAQHFSPDRAAPESHHFEDEADHAAEKVLVGGSVPALGAASPGDAQRQGKDDKKELKQPKVVPPVKPTAAQRKVIDVARRVAAVRTQVAKFKATGLHGDAAFQDARQLAQIKFDWDLPNMEQIGEVLSGMGGGLIGVDVKVAGFGDPQCGSRAGYVSNHRPPIVLCPAFFTDPTGAEGRSRTMIHEMAHLQGVGSADVGEEYFVTFDCTSKGSFESADSWANYVHCLSGQTPDKPVEIKGKGAGKTAPPKKPERTAK
ncbi:DUF4157 domain-containing protein [Rhodococcus sp. T2V]|uniref:eCIS core domain-containing protein n=1 Tax=Rhodococcus sp. T2V TaxID=3034164 RepID=UPI0023E1D4E0|nr:DUF4157 domain-containing protein [Rhodococcus sp. T2V]MDF3308893.1 DUF4157 domain-containing protein [Rhodococcus sp. T2V]